jgi:predicted metalloprotease with PDZ domain
LGFFVFSSIISAEEKVLEPKQGYLGVNLTTLTRLDKRQLEVEFGILISSVQKQSPADKAGILEDDVIQYCNGKKVKDIQTFSEYVRDTYPGKEIKIKLIRLGKNKVIRVKVGERDQREMTYFGKGRFKSGEDFKFYDKGLKEWKEFGKLKNFDKLKGLSKLKSLKRFEYFMPSGKTYLGIHMHRMNKDLKKYFHKSGALILKVEEDSPAEKAGLKSGDVIVEINKKKILDIDDVTHTLLECKPDEKIHLKIVRHNQTMSIKVKLDKNTGSFGMQLFSGRGSIPEVLENLDINIPFGRFFKFHCPDEKTIILKSKNKDDKVKSNKIIEKVGENILL